jgi:hypothetical protein
MYWLFALSVFITLGLIFMLYRHFNVLFESQYELTAQVLATFAALTKNSEEEYGL